MNHAIRVLEVEREELARLISGCAGSNSYGYSKERMKADLADTWQGLIDLKEKEAQRQMAKEAGDGD